MWRHSGGGGGRRVVRESGIRKWVGGDAKLIEKGWGRVGGGRGWGLGGANGTAPGKKGVAGLKREEGETGEDTLVFD